MKGRLRAFFARPLWRGLLVASLVLCATSESPAMDIRDKTFLAQKRDELVWFALHHKPRQSKRAGSFVNVRYGNFAFIDTIVFRAPASRISAALTEDFFDDGEIIGDGMVNTVVSLLTQLYRVSIYKSMSFFPLSVLNISIGPPKDLLNKRRSGETAIARAYSHIVGKLDLPIVASAGNHGPQAGTINPWATTVGVIAATAADARGTHLWEAASRPTAYDLVQDRYFLFSAHGENTIGALAQGQTKTPRMLAIEQEIDMAGTVGADMVPYFSVQSGTSFAAGTISQLVCYVHQLVSIMGAYANFVNHAQYPVSPFVRGYIDTGIDEKHPVFNLRLADKAKKYGGLLIDIDPIRRERFYSFFASNLVNLRLEYGHRVVVRYLKAISRPIDGVPPSEGGHGFVSFDAAKQFVRTARYSNLIELLADDGDDRVPEWISRARASGDPLLLSSEEATAVIDYCEKKDLVLALPLSMR